MLRVQQASHAELELWGERVLDAASLDEVFAPQTHFRVGNKPSWRCCPDLLYYPYRLRSYRASAWIVALGFVSCLSADACQCAPSATPSTAHDARFVLLT